MQLTELIDATMGYKNTNDEKGMATFVKTNHAQIKELFERMMGHIERPGIENVKTFLAESDFYTAPSSTRYHCAFEGGLMVHSLLVYYCLAKKVTAPIWKGIIGQTSPETILIVALFHDICKVNFYQQDWKNAKIYSPSGSKHDAKGAYDWESVPIYTCDDKAPLGHGEKSVIELLRHGLQMTDEEIYAIRWHMGFTDKSDPLNVGNTFKICPLAYAISEADMEATYLLELEPQN